MHNTDERHYEVLRELVHHEHDRREEVAKPLERRKVFSKYDGAPGDDDNVLTVIREKMRAG